MRIITTYDLHFEDGQTTQNFPIGSKILSISVRKEFLLGKFVEVPVIVVEKDETLRGVETRKFMIVPIKETFKLEDHTYLGTIALDNGTSSFNVFYRKL